DRHDEEEDAPEDPGHPQVELPPLGYPAEPAAHATRLEEVPRPELHPPARQRGAVHRRDDGLRSAEGIDRSVVGGVKTHGPQQVDVFELRRLEVMAPAAVDEVQEV